MQIPGHWTASLARRIGLDHNPLRRGTDRAEAWIRIVLVLVFLAGAPVAGWAAGHWAGSTVPTAAHARLAGEHRIPATLLNGVPAGSNYFSAVGFGWVRARWTAPGGSVHTGYVEAPAGSRAGGTVPVWLDRTGRFTAPPLTRSQAQGLMLMTAAFAPAVLALLLLAVMGLVGLILERRRLASWKQAWSAIEPQWSRRPR